MSVLGTVVSWLREQIPAIVLELWLREGRLVKRARYLRLSEFHLSFGGGSILNLLEVFLKAIWGIRNHANVSFHLRVLCINFNHFASILVKRYILDQASLLTENPFSQRQSYSIHARSSLVFPFLFFLPLPSIKLNSFILIRLTVSFINSSLLRSCAIFHAWGLWEFALQARPN